MRPMVAMLIMLAMVSPQATVISYHKQQQHPLKAKMGLVSELHLIKILR